MCSKILLPSLRYYDQKIGVVTRGLDYIIKVLEVGLLKTTCHAYSMIKFIQTIGYSKTIVSVMAAKAAIK